MTAYEWGDPKNPEYVEWILDQIDQRRKDVQHDIERNEYYRSGMTANRGHHDLDAHDVHHDTHGTRPEPRFDDE